MKPDYGLIKWELRRWRRRLGWPGVAGVALLALSVLFYVAVVIPQRFDAEALRQRVAAAEAALRTGKVAQGEGPEARLAVFYRSFPERGTAAAWLEKIYAAGSTQGLALDKGEYRLDSERDSRLARYEINLPVHGSYAQVRRFIQAVLAEIPSIALTDVEFRRASIKEGEIEARMRFVLYLREVAS